MADSDSEDSSDELYHKFLNGSIGSDTDSGEDFVLGSDDEPNDSDTDSGSDVSKEIDLDEIADVQVVCHEVKLSKEADARKNVENVGVSVLSNNVKSSLAAESPKMTAIIECAENTENVPPPNMLGANDTHPKQGIYP